MTREQITLKLGLDSADAEIGAARVNRAMQGIGQSGHKSFLHAQTGAKGFKKMLHEIIDVSPIMGNALRLAISPAAGIFMAAAAGVGYLHEKLKKMNEEWDKTATDASKPIVDMKANLRDAAKEVANVEHEFSKWLEGQQESPSHKIMQGLKDSLATLNEKAKGAIGAGADPVETERKRLQLQWTMTRNASRAIGEQERQEAERVDTFKRVLSHKMGQSRIKEAEQLVAKETEARKHAQNELDANTTASVKGAGWLDKAKHWLMHAGVTRTKDGQFIAESSEDNVQRALTEKKQELTEKIKQSTKLIEAQQRVIDNETKARTATAEQLFSHQKKFSELGATRASLLDQLEGTRLALSGMPFSAASNSNPIQSRYNSWREQMAEKLSAWNKSQEINRGNPETGILGISSKKADTIETLLDKMLKKYETGVMVIGAPDK